MSNFTYTTTEEWYETVKLHTHENIQNSKSSDVSYTFTRSDDYSFSFNWTTTEGALIEGMSLISE
jgi:hypothetical protein